MRTTIRLPDDLLGAAKAAAHADGTTLTAVVEDALRSSLARRVRAANRQRIELPTYGGSGTLPGVDLDSAAALLDLMESED